MDKMEKWGALQGLPMVENINPEKKKKLKSVAVHLTELGSTISQMLTTLDSAADRGAGISAVAEKELDDFIASIEGLQSASSLEALISLMYAKAVVIKTDMALTPSHKTE